VGPGNLFLIEIQSANVREAIIGFGMKGVPAEKVAGDAVLEAREYLDSGAAVGEHLCDQLLIPVALTGKGQFTTSKWSSHSETNANIIREFLGKSFTVTPDGKRVRVSL